MIEVKAVELERMKPENLQEILRAPGPCVTLVLPPYRPGEQSKSPATLLKADLQEARRQLKEARVDDATASALLEPVHDLEANSDLESGSHCGRVIFSAPGLFRQYQLSEPAQAAVTVGERFHIRGILGELHGVAAELYVLKVSQKGVDLVKCGETRSESVPLPKGVPATLDEAMAFDAPDHDLENRSAAGSSSGAMRGVRFGTGSGRETQHAHFADYYRMVDRGLTEYLRPRKATLVLVGVDEDTALYHSVASYAGLLKKSIHGNAKGFTYESELARHAFDIARTELLERETRELAESKEKLGPARFLTDPKKALAAAIEGRVQRLYVSNGASVLERFDGAGYQSKGPEDLVNLAAAQTMLHGGDALAMPAEKMPEGAALAAILRF